MHETTARVQVVFDDRVQSRIQDVITHERPGMVRHFPGIFSCIECVTELGERQVCGVGYWSVGIDRIVLGLRPCIVGDAGMGKSRLLYEFSNWSDLRPEPFWYLLGRATPQMTHRPYALLRDIVSFRFDIRDNDKPDVVRQKLEEGVAKQIGEEKEMAHLLGHLSGFDFSNSPYISGLLGDPQQLTDWATYGTRTCTCTRV